MCKFLDVGFCSWLCWILDVGWWMLDFGCFVYRFKVWFILGSIVYLEHICQKKMVKFCNSCLNVAKIVSSKCCSSLCKCCQINWPHIATWQLGGSHSEPPGGPYSGPHNFFLKNQLLLGKKIL